MNYNYSTLPDQDYGASSGYATLDQAYSESPAMIDLQKKYASYMQPAVPATPVMNPPHLQPTDQLITDNNLMMHLSPQAESKICAGVDNLIKNRQNLNNSTSTFLLDRNKPLVNNNSELLENFDINIKNQPCKIFGVDWYKFLFWLIVIIVVIGLIVWLVRKKKTGRVDTEYSGGMNGPMYKKLYTNIK